jgi:threonine dehydrogenase-like Zn-dependent dehydrogenase
MRKEQTMAVPKTCKVAAKCGDGHIRVVEEDMPALRPGRVLTEVHASLISPGTELGGWRDFSARRQNPDADAPPRPFGYSNAGVVIEVGEGVETFKPGDRVASVGAGCARHADYAVTPHNLCVPLPERVTFSQGCYAMLAGTALQGLRRGEPVFGEFAAIAGLGIIGQIAAQLYRLAGNFVVGWDTIPFRIELAAKLGIDKAINVLEEDAVDATRQFTGGHGLDAAVLAFGGEADKAMDSLLKSMKCSPDGHPMGRIVVIGGARFQYTSPSSNLDIRRASRTGPGYHDEAWEVGAGYPPVFMRWTTQTNLRLCIRLMAEGRLDVGALTTHTIPLERADEETSAMLDDPDGILGVVFTMNGGDAS